MGEIIITEANGNKLLITDDEQKSNAFVEYFSSVFSHEPDTLFEEIPKVNLAYDMSNLIITDVVVLNKLSTLKIDKSPGPWT